MSPLFSNLMNAIRNFERPALLGGVDHRLEAMEAYLATNREADGLFAIIEWARRRYELYGTVTIDVGETEVRQHPMGLEIRAWCLVQGATVTSLDQSEGGRAAITSMGPRTRAIVRLRIGRGLPTTEIARQFKLRHSTVRRHLRLAVRAVARETSP